MIKRIVFISHMPRLTYTRLFILLQFRFYFLIIVYQLNVLDELTAKLNTNKSQLSLIAKFPYIK